MLPSTAITRFDLASTFFEFNLAASRQNFIGPRALRPRLVGVQAADVGKVAIEALLQTLPDDRAPGAGYRRSDAEFAKFSYSTDEKGHEVPLDDRQLKLYRDVLDAESILSGRAGDIVLRNFEIACAAALYDTGVWTGASLTTACTTEWDTRATSVPLTDIEGAVNKVFDGSGLKANALICNQNQFKDICEAVQILDRLKYWGGDDPKNVNAGSIAALTDLDYILVAGGAKNTANLAQSVSLSRIWGDEYAMVARIAVTDDPQEACVGRTFMWSEENAGVGDENELALIVEEYREEGVRGSVIRARNDRDIVIMYPEAAHLLSNCHT